MKNNALKAFLLIFILLIISLAYNQIKKSNIVENNQDIVTKDTLIVMSIEQKNIKESFGTTTIENNKTKYSDGRFTAVRNLRYYNDLIKTSIPMKDSRLGLTTIMTEWNEYDGNVASPQGGFIEKPMFLNEVEKKEMREAGIDQSDTFSTMVGGDEETNRRFVEPSKRYWVVASKMFEQEFANLIKAEDISDRTVDYVTFDFITTDGFYTVQIKKSELESGKSVWSKVFEESKFLNIEMARVQKESAADDERRNEAKQLQKTKKVLDPKTNMENTKYSDGRTSEVRTEYYYTESIKTLDKNTDLKLFFFVMEYNDYEAVVSDKDGVFGQLPNNTMTQIKKNVAGQNFFIFVDTVFQKNLNLLTLMTKITDRSVDTVSFDFVTNKGVYTVQESKINLEKGNSIWSELYKKAKESKPKN